MNLLTDKGGFRITYAHPSKGLSVSMLKEQTLMNAMSVFNSLDLTTGFECLGDIIVDRLNTDGVLTDTFVMSGRYAVPKRTGPRLPNKWSGRPSRPYKRNYRR